MPKDKFIKFQSTLWKYQGENSSWHFFTLPYEESVFIKYSNLGGIRRGWGAVKVEVTIGKTTWATSIFPESKSGCYILPVKASVRKIEKISEGNNYKVKIKLI